LSHSRPSRDCSDDNAWWDTGFFCGCLRSSWKYKTPTTTATASVQPGTAPIQDMALQAKAAAENELILLKNHMTMLPMHNGFFQHPGQSMQPLGQMSLPSQHVQHPQQGGPQLMQPLGGMSLLGQHVQGAMSDLRCLQQHTCHNEREYFNQEDTSNLTSMPASCYAPSLDYSMSDFVSCQHKQYYQHGEN
jgi:hypothetical protein